ncbi:MAG: glycosyltransferase family 4 protein [Desulfovibrionaceae bacterium]
MSLPLDVVFLTQDLCIGGTQRQTLELAQRMDTKRFSPAVWTLSGPTDLDDLAIKEGLPVHHLGKTVMPGPLSVVALMGKLFTDCPDILVPCMAPANIWGRITGQIRRVPVIVGTCRGGGAPVRQHEQFMWHLAHHMVCNSMQLYNILQGLGMPSGRVTYIPNGVDTDFFEAPLSPLPERAPVVLCVARLVSDKDHMTLLRAFGRVLEHIPHARLRFVGDGPQEFTLRKFIEAPPFKGHVEIIPGGTDMRMHYQQAQVFALASIREGQPNVILEAMSSGLPVAATNVGGIPSLVREGYNGFLSASSDSVTLAQNICRLLNDPALCKSMGDAGRELALQNFAFSAMVKSHQDLFERLWELRQGSAPREENKI